MASYILEAAKIKTLGTPNIYLLPATRREIVDEKEKLRKCEIGVDCGPLEEKVMLVVGESGAGKTTMIQFIINYVLDVQWDDEFRYQLDLDDEEKDLSRHQTKSQTQWVTSYTLNYQKNSNFPYKLTIIDTPGFEDTDSNKKDKSIAKQIQRHFMSMKNCGRESLDAVIFVIKATVTRLTGAQKSVFNSVLDLFGKDVSQNIFLFLTHGELLCKPPALAAVHESKIPYSKSYTFDNNYAFKSRMDKNLSKEDQEDLLWLHKRHWRMGTKSLNEFSKDLQLAPRQSIELSAEVLEERETIDLILKRLPDLITTQIVSYDKFKDETFALEEHEKEMKEHENFTYTVKEEVVVEIPLEGDEMAMNCKVCRRTCHCPCPHSIGRTGSLCSAMKWASAFRGCYVCDNNCDVTDHEKQGYKYERKIEEKTRTKEDIKRRYDKAKGSKEKKGELVRLIQNDMVIAEKKIDEYVAQMRKCLKRLKEIALRPDFSTVVDYLGSLITKERMGGQVGYENRVKWLKKLIDKENILKDDWDEPIGPLLTKLHIR